MPFPLSLLAATVVVSAPVTTVTVYSDQARVTRTATLSLSGTERIELPLLGDRISPDSLRVEAEGADVRRVDITHVDAGDFPMDEARKLLEAIEQVDDKIARAQAQRDAPKALLDAVQALSPSLPPPDPMKPTPRLNPVAWGAAFSFVDGWMERMQARVRVEND